MSLPAARLTDMHVCPMWTGPVPHVGGPILAPGWPTVLIVGLPAARMTDMVTCAGPPDMIAFGSPRRLSRNSMRLVVTGMGGSLMGWDPGCRSAAVATTLGRGADGGHRRGAPYSGAPAWGFRRLGH